jgi:hypothetical protein
MNLDFTNEELNNLMQILDKELSYLDKEIHRTDALVYKHELEEKLKSLDNLKKKLQQVIS